MRFAKLQRDEHHARRDGAEWRSFEVAYAGERLYSGEADDAGLATLDPQDPRVVYISTTPTRTRATR